MALESTLEYQDEDGALILKTKNESGKKGTRLLNFYDTLQEACEEYSPDKDLGVDVHIRAWSRTGVVR